MPTVDRSTVHDLPAWLSHQYTHVVTIALAGLLAKLAIARRVAINGDSGLYIYDAMQILQGRAFMVDFPSRSPVFEYALAAVIALGDASTPMLSVRAFMILISVALGLAIYAFARQVFDHRVGLASALLFYATPFTLVWGVWVKTEQAATLLALVGFIVALRHIDRERVPYAVMAAVGVAFGVAFLIRRVAIVHAGAFGLFYLWYRYRHHGDHPLTLATRASTTALAALGTTFVAYLALALHAGGGPALAAQLADAHGFALVTSEGQGSLGWIHTPDAPTTYVETRDGLIWQLCQKCGDNTALVFAQTAFVTLPAAILAAIPLRARMRRFDVLTTDYLAPAVLIGPLLYAFASSPNEHEAIAALVAAVGIVVVWFSSPIDWRTYWRPKAVLPAATFGALAAGYLYRDRILYTTYFQDLFPFMAVLAGAAGVAWVARNTRADLRVALGVVLVVSLVAAGAHAYPLTEAPEHESHWFTVGGVETYGEDIDARTEPGQPVFTAQPLYVIHSEATVLADLSRQYYLYRSWPDSPQTQRTTDTIVAALESGRAPYAVADANLKEITTASPEIREALDRHYCAVDAPIYDRTDATLLAHESTGECE